MPEELEILHKTITSKISSDWKSKIVQHTKKSDGHNCGQLILKKVWRTTAQLTRLQSMKRKVQCDFCKRWAHMTRTSEGTSQENLNYEKKEYKFKKCAQFTSLPRNNIMFKCLLFKIFWNKKKPLL